MTDSTKLCKVNDTIKFKKNNNWIDGKIIKFEFDYNNNTPIWSIKYNTIYNKPNILSINNLIVKDVNNEFYKCKYSNNFEGNTSNIIKLTPSSNFIYN